MPRRDGPPWPSRYARCARDGPASPTPRPAGIRPAPPAYIRRPPPADGAISAAELVDLTAAVGGSQSPRWSPDGSRITFVSGGDLGAVGTEDGAFEILTEDLSLSGVGSLGAPQPVWSPDGRWIAYTSDKSGAPEIWLWSAEAGDGMDIQLTRLAARANGLAWSPDSRSIAFSGDRFGNMDIWTVSVPDGAVNRLTDDPLYEGYPSWTPDGSRLLHVRMDDRWVDHDVIEVDPDGTNPRMVVRDTGFSTTGRRGPSPRRRCRPTARPCCFARSAAAG